MGIWFDVDVDVEVVAGIGAVDDVVVGCTVVVVVVDVVVVVVVVVVVGERLRPSVAGSVPPISSMPLNKSPIGTKVSPSH